MGGLRLHEHIAAHGILFHEPPALHAFGSHDLSSEPVALRIERAPALFEDLHQQSH